MTPARREREACLISGWPPLSPAASWIMFASQRFLRWFGPPFTSTSKFLRRGHSSVGAWMRRRAVSRARRWRQRSAADCDIFVYMSGGPVCSRGEGGWSGDGDLCSASRGELPVDPADGPSLPSSPQLSARSRQSIQPTAHHLRSSRMSSERRSCLRRSGHQSGAVGGRPRGTVEGEAPRESTMTKLRPAAARRGRRSCTPRVQRAEG